MESDFSRTFVAQSRKSRYGFAVVCTILGIAARYTLNPVLGPSDVPFLLAYPAVAAAAWIGGLGPAILCSILSALATSYFFFVPVRRFFPITATEAVSLVVFVGASLLIAFLGERSRRALNRLTAEFTSRLEKESELRRTGERLRVAEDASSQLAAIVTSSDDAILSMDLTGIITSWNEAASRMFGYAAEEITGKPIFTMIPPELYEEEHRILRRIRDGQPIEHFETVRLRKDGEPLHVSLSVSPIRDRSGRVIGASKMARDITEQKRAEEALRKTEMEAAKGRLAASIAHEINNPLEAITNVGYLIAMAPELSPSSRELVVALNAEVSRVSDITRQALAFYRETAEPSAVSVAAIVDGVLELFRRRMAQKSVKLDVLYADNIPRILVKAGELRQVVANLLANALDAVPDGGHIVIRTRSTPSLVRITVCDNGEGIPPDRRDLIFRPFETTKGEKGTGLGLWVSKGLVEKYGGRILYRSSQNPQHRGTSFTVILPRLVMEEAGAA
jgi:PAS domain S-box-containing protein